MKRISTTLFLVLFLWSSSMLASNTFNLNHATTASLEEESNATSFVNEVSCLTREGAVELLMDQIDFDPDQSNVWSPYKDFGFGDGYEGLLPEGTVIDPAFLGIEPYPGQTMTLDAPAYFFWVNDEKPALFIHQTRFVLLKFKCDGDNLVFIDLETTVQGWWPVINTPDGGAQAYFDSDYNRVSDAAASFNNTNGLILGVGLSSSDVASGPFPTQNPDVQVNDKAYGIIARGDGDSFFEEDVKQFCDDLMNVHGVPKENIVKANGGNAAGLDDLEKAIDSLCTLGAGGCTKIYVRITAHGGKGTITLDGEKVPKDTLCKRFEGLSAKKVPICYLIDACHSGSLIDDDIWNAPPGSTVITGADGNGTSWGHSIKFLLGTDTVKGSLYPHAFGKCLRDKKADKNKDKKVDECEAHDWILKQKPCYTWCENDTNYYPAGAPAGTPGPVTPNPNPQKKRIKSLDVKIKEGPNKGRKYHAPDNASIKVCGGQLIEYAVPASATNITWTVDGELISEEMGQGKATVDLHAPAAGATSVYTVSYVYNGEEYSYSIKVSSRKCIDGENQDVANWQGKTYATGQLLSSEDSDIAIRLYNEDRLLILDKRIGAEGFDYGYGIAVDHLGHTVTTGTFEDLVEFESQNLAAKDKQDIFIVKHNSEGEELWVKRAGSYKNDAGQDIALDDQGNIYVVGYYEGEADFDNTSLPFEGEGANGFLAKYNTDGMLLWSRHIGGEGHDAIQNVVVDNEGFIYTTGIFSGTAQFGSVNLITETTSLFIAKYNTDGSLLWAKSSEGTAAEGISIDPAGNILVLSQNEDQAHLLKYLSSGTLEAETTLNGVGAVVAKDLTITADGIIHLVGHFYEGIYFKQEIKTAKGAADVFLAQFSSDLTLDWIKTEGGTEDDFAFAVYNEGTGFTSYAGCHFGTATIGGNTSSAPAPSYIPYLAALMDGTTTNTTEAEMDIAIHKVFPNPFVKNFTVELTTSTNQQLKIEMLDVSGRVVYQHNFFATKGKNLIELQLENKLSEGVYLLQMTNQKGQQITQKLRQL